MKRKMLLAAATVVISVLRLMDRYISGSRLDISDEEEVRDPYKVWRALRPRGNVLRSYANRGWMALGFEEVQALFRDPRFSSDIRTNKFISGAMRAASPNGRATTAGANLIRLVTPAQRATIISGEGQTQ